MEYGTEVNGQVRSPRAAAFTDKGYTRVCAPFFKVLGGRWKPLHYWYAKFLFADIGVACGVSGACYVKNGVC